MFTTTSGRSKVGDGVMLGVRVMVGVLVMVGVAVMVAVAVIVAVRVGLGSGVLVNVAVEGGCEGVKTGAACGTEHALRESSGRMDKHIQRRVIFICMAGF